MNMAWDGVERRIGADRRVKDRRRSLRYSAYNLIIVDGVTWVDDQGTDRRQFVRRLQDRLRLAQRIKHLAGSL
jgi:hypothetical protein